MADGSTEIIHETEKLLASNLSWLANRLKSDRVNEIIHFTNPGTAIMV